MNPIAILDGILADYASPKARRTIHAVLALVLLIVTVVIAAGGDWKEALLSLAVSVYAALNKANTPATDLDPAGADTDVDDGLSYEEVGGLPFPGEQEYNPYDAPGEPYRS